jgi:hypothetical protein
MPNSARKASVDTSVNISCQDSGKWAQGFALVSINWKTLLAIEFRGIDEFAGPV